ncbi:MAG: MMPL family transporter, partial [Eubacteriales bacterium]
MKSKQNDLMYRIAKHIVYRRNLIFFLFTLLCAFCLVSISWGETEDDLTAFLDENSITRRGLEVMEAEFVTFATADVMVNHIDIPTAFAMKEILSAIDGVQMVTFEENEDHYKDASALFSLMFSGEEGDEITLSAMAEVRELTAPYDTAINSTIGVDAVADLTSEMAIITVIAIVVVVVVLVLTSKSYAEIPVFFLTFGVAALLNMGTNFIFGTISFISDSVGVILQLALAIDYAIILCHRYAEEREHYEAEEACTVALSKAIIEISSSSLTTVCGLIALSFMSYSLGADLSKVLIKSIFLSLFCVFFFMPGLLVLCSDLIDRTKHRNFVPSIAVIGRISIKLRYIVPPIFLVLSMACAYWSNQTEYLFSEGNVRAATVSPRLQQKDRIIAKFGSTNALVLIVPSGSYETESALIAHLESYEEVTGVMGLANTEAMDGYMLTDSLNPREFSQLLGLDYEAAQALYAAYALENEEY